MKLAINRCPNHKQFWAISVDHDHGGQRVTPGKCCGRWEIVQDWRLTADQWRELARAAEEAAEESESEPVVVPTVGSVSPPTQET